MGVILYEMCTLQHPFDGQGLMAVMYANMEMVPLPIPTLYAPAIQDLINTHAPAFLFLIIILLLFLAFIPR